MKTCTSVIVVCILTCCFSSCTKEMSLEDVAASVKFKSFVLDKKFQISEYYSNRPIDYNEEDSVVKSETDLFKYASSWLKDDYNTFNLFTNKVTIEQNTKKISGNKDAIITRDIAVGEDKSGVYFTFLDYQYNSFTYRLVEYKEDYFILSASWHSGATVYTKFRVVSQ
ncbi:MAG: hypothetical protein ABI415_10310 [Flavitalea sp.]